MKIAIKLPFALLFLSATLASADPSPARIKELTHFVRQECGFCHGLHLTGGLGSPLTAPALHGKDAETLIAATLHGIPGTAMPGWAPFLSNADAHWIIHALKTGFPK
ncbi:MAG: cytochrome c [Betaproteobacteria bacterium]|nr:MAG: cytochrome c [Betaproteobacteria bacterium]